MPVGPFGIRISDHLKAPLTALVMAARSPPCAEPAMAMAPLPKSPAVYGLTAYYRVPPDQLSAAQVQDYLLYVMQQRQLNWNSAFSGLFGLPGSGSGATGLAR